MHNPFALSDEPTQEEILEAQQRQAALKEQWTPEQEKARRVCSSAVEWSVPQYYVEYVAPQPGVSSVRRNLKVKVYRPLG